MLFWLQLSLKTLAFNKLITPETTSGLSCLQSACVKGDIETVNAILNYSPDKLDSAIAMGIKIGYNSSVFPGKSLLTVLRLKGSETHKQISELVEKVTKHFQSQSLLHLAAKRGNTEHLRRLLECGEHVDSLSPDLMEGLRETPLMLAARYNEVDVVEFLIERGASLEAQDIEYLRPIHHAVKGGKISNVLRLIELGAKVSKENLDYRSPVHLAAECGHTDIVRLLLEHGVDATKCVACSGRTPIMLAAGNGHLETLKLLLINGCDLDKADESGQLCLHCAAEGDHFDLVKFILESGGNVLSKLALVGQFSIWLPVEIWSSFFLKKAQMFMQETATVELHYMPPLERAKPIQSSIFWVRGQMLTHVMILDVRLCVRLCRVVMPLQPKF